MASDNIKLLNAGWAVFMEIITPKQVSKCSQRFCSVFLSLYVYSCHESSHEKRLLENKSWVVTTLNSLKQMFLIKFRMQQQGLLVIALIYHTLGYSDFHLSFRKKKKSVGICCVWNIQIFKHSISLSHTSHWQGALQPQDCSRRSENPVTGHVTYSHRWPISLQSSQTI